jgi:hypothetical protein
MLLIFQVLARYLNVRAISDAISININIVEDHGTFYVGWLGLVRATMGTGDGNPAGQAE